MSYKPNVRVVTITAGSGGGTGNAVALTEGILNIITTSAAHGDSVILPACTAGSVTSIVNSGAKDVGVYPASGGTIDGSAANAVYYLASGSRQDILCVSPGTFLCLVKSQRMVTFSPSADTWSNSNINTSSTVFHKIVTNNIVPPSAYSKPCFISFLNKTAAVSMQITGDVNAVGQAGWVDRHYVYSGYPDAANDWLNCDAEGNFYIRVSGNPTSNLSFNILGWMVEG